MATTSRGIFYPTTSDSVEPATRDFKTLATTTTTAINNAVAEAKWENGNIQTSADLNTITTQGGYSVPRYTVASSLTNAPTLPLAINSAKLNVYDNGNGGIVQEWTTLPNASIVSIKLQRHRDSTGAWSAWKTIGNDTSTISANQDINSLTQNGFYFSPNYTTTASLLNSPSGVISAISASALITVAGYGKIVFQQWETGAVADGREAPVLRRRRDELGNWSSWERVQVGANTQSAVADFSSVARSAYSNQRGLITTLLKFSGEKFPVWAMTAPPAQEPLKFPSHSGSDSATHPSVLYKPDGWNGYKYWCAYTPYPDGKEAHEDPNIVASNDGQTWVVPAGLSNPLDDQPGAPGPYNSDTNLTWGPDGELVCTWRTVDRPNGGRNIFYQRTSVNGTTWTAKREIFSPPLEDWHSSALAPVLEWTGTKWRMWVISSRPAPNQLVLWETTVRAPSHADWSAPTVCDLDMKKADRDPWHIDILPYQGGYLGLLNDAVRGVAGVDGDLYFMRSDDGIKWELSDIPVISKTGAKHDSMYKSTFVPSGSGEDLTLDIFYAAFSRSDRNHRVFRTTAAFVNGAQEGEGDIDLTTLLPGVGIAPDAGLWCSQSTVTLTLLGRAPQGAIAGGEVGRIPAIFAPRKPVYGSGQGLGEDGVIIRPDGAVIYPPIPSGAYYRTTITWAI